LWALAGFAAVVALLVLLATLVPAPPRPVSYASGSKPTIAQSSTGEFGFSTTTYTWTVDSTRPVRSHFRLTNQASTLPGHLTVEPSKGCRPHVQWAMSTDGKTVADGTLTDTDNHKIKAVVPDNAKTLDITATYEQDACTATLSWVIST
jgi:hypothetical protein